MTKFNYEEHEAMGPGVTQKKDHGHLEVHNPFFSHSDDFDYGSNLVTNAPMKRIDCT